MFQADQRNSSDHSSSDAANDSNSNNKQYYSAGDVWLAELAYRTAVARQEARTEGAKLEAFLKEAKHAERQRRLKLRHFLQDGLLAKHALAFERVQQVHTESLENYFEYNSAANDDLDIEFASNSKDSDDGSLSTKRTDGVSTKKSGKRKKGKRVYTTRERIELMAETAGTTPLFDDDPVEKEEEKEETASAAAEEQSTAEDTREEASVAEQSSTATSGVDLDSIDPSLVDLEESDLPKLRDAKSAKSSDTKSIKSEAKSIKSAASASSKQRSTKSKTSSKSVNKKPGPKVKAGVILDEASNLNAAFLDRLLYSGSLLESHYILLATVAGVDPQEDVGVPFAMNMETVEPTVVLVVITKDRTIHMFNLPSMEAQLVSTESGTDGGQPHQLIVPGSPPEDALRVLLKHQARLDLEEKNEKELLDEQEADAANARPKFMRSKTTEKEETKDLFFRNLVPSVSMSTDHYSIRTTNRGDHAVKIASKTRAPVPVHGNINYSKLSFGSSADQQAFVTASQPLGGELTTI